LHCHTPFTLRGAGSSIAALVTRARALGMSALAITDTMTLAGVVRFHYVCQEAGVRPITGCELVVRHDDSAGDEAGAGGTFLALARDQEGYATLCGLLTRANLTDSKAPIIPFADLAAHHTGLALLVGGCDGLVQRLLVAGRVTEARAVLAAYVTHLGADHLCMELSHHLLPESGGLLVHSAILAAEVGIPCIATNGVRYAIPEDARIYDLLTCVRLGVHADEPHPARPRNREQYLKGIDKLPPCFAAQPDGFAHAAALAATCQVELLAERCRPPQVLLPDGVSPDAQLRVLCQAGVTTRYPTVSGQAAAQRQLEHELKVIHQLDLAEFFLVVHDIVDQARQRGIRCAGRGSAANSVVAYVLGITAVDPIAHHLLFERFLSPERVGMPDIDLDVQSSRREELIAYVEQTYTERHAAMVANVVTYRLRLAVRDVAKTLGFPLPVIDRLTRRLPHFGAIGEVARYADEFARVLAEHMPGQNWSARLQLLLELVPRLEGFPRHLSLHNGGMLLTRRPLTELLPVRRSANGVRAVELDKDDVEALGLIKFDLLGLRTFDAIERCLDLIQQTEGKRPEVDTLPLDPSDPATMALVRAGQTLAVFQIESPAQWSLLARTQPQTFDELVIETALCRPGPIQAGMVHPYIARRQGLQPVTYPHPALEPVLRDTLGIVLYQEQVLQIAHTVAGLSYGEAEGFRKAMSHYRTSSEMEGMRAAFVDGAVGQGVARALATRIFNDISGFVGYGFCRSHAAAFARTIYQTAWLKAHYPAHYLAAFLASQPAGFFPPATVLEEAKHLGIPVLPVDMQASAAAFSVERLDGEPGCPWAIRIGLAQVKHVGEGLARAIVTEREQHGAYRSLAEFCARLGPTVPLRHEAVVALVAAGAFDAFGIPRRRLLWLLETHWRDWQVPQPRRQTATPHPAVQTPLAWEWPAEQAAEAPRLPPLTLEDEVRWDLASQGLSARPHPLTFCRRWLASVGVVPIESLGARVDGDRVLVAGHAIAAQRPPTAKGVGFLVLEDETGRMQIVLPPQLADVIRPVLAESRQIAVAGRLECTGAHRTVLAGQVRPLPLHLRAGGRHGRTTGTVGTRVDPRARAGAAGGGG
jgi:error-prone DNA polymerase